jgi:hypothetical protein
MYLDYTYRSLQQRENIKHDIGMMGLGGGGGIMGQGPQVEYVCIPTYVHLYILICIYGQVKGGGSYILLSIFIYLCFCIIYVLMIEALFLTYLYIYIYIYIYMFHFVTGYEKAQGVISTSITLSSLSLSSSSISSSSISSSPSSSPSILSSLSLSLSSSSILSTGYG